MCSMFLVSPTVPCGRMVCTVVHEPVVGQHAVAEWFLFKWFVNCCLQRDLFSQLMVHAAMKSEKTRNQKLGRCVIDLLKYARPV